MPAPQHRDAEGPTDHQLVAAVRRGDDRAFECLYHRYNRRIQAYVVGMCKDHARAEDITQEIFVSALRRMRETERPIAFKPWVYEIAKNACIDQHRRSRRAEEISLQSEDGLAPADYGRLVNADPTPDVAVSVKQSLDHLCGAFGGLSDTHHDILVMRELEGLSYREIGERLGMSRPAVESTLFRARRRLTEEYGELVSGQRCLRIQGIIATASRGRLGARDATRLSRHVAHCIPCRRDALAAGLDAAMLAKPMRTRVAAKVAAFLPFPLLTRRFTAGGADDAAATRVPSSWMTQLPVISDHAGAGWTKAIAAVAVLLAGVGAGVGTRAATKPSSPAMRAGTQAHERAITSSGGGAAARGPLVAPRAAAARSAATAATAASRTTARHRTRRSTSSTAPSSTATTPVRTATGAAKPVTDAIDAATRGKLPTSVSSTPSQAVKQTTQAASNTLTGVTKTIQGATNAVSGATGGGPVGGTVGAVGNAVGSAGQAAGSAVQSTGSAVSGVVGGATG